MTKTSLEELRNEKPSLLTVFWCDRCQRTINRNEDTEHYHEQQCGGCKQYRALDSDWRYCSGHQSVYSARRINEHDTCSKWIEGKW